MSLYKRDRIRCAISMRKKMTRTHFFFVCNGFENLVCIYTYSLHLASYSGMLSHIQ